MTGGVIKLCTGAGIWISKGGEFEDVAIKDPMDPFKLMWTGFKENIIKDTEPETNGYYGREIINIYRTDLSV